MAQDEAKHLHRRVVMQRRNIGLIIVLILVAFLAWIWPKSQAFGFSPNMVGYYRGFGILEENIFLIGKSYYLVTEERNHAYYEVEYRHPGYNHFRGFYDNGVLREEGECFVELSGFYNRPCPEISDVRIGKYFKPDGTLGSEVRDGSGVQTYWTDDGVKIWELETRDFKRVRHSIWYPNGQVADTQKYCDGNVDGEFIGYYPSGAKKIEGAYSLGDRVGSWTRYNEDGSIKAVENY